MQYRSVHILYECTSSDSQRDAPLKLGIYRASFEVHYKDVWEAGSQAVRRKA